MMIIEITWIDKGVNDNKEWKFLFKIVSILKILNLFPYILWHLWSYFIEIFLINKYIGKNGMDDIKIKYFSK